MLSNAPMRVFANLCLAFAGVFTAVAGTAHAEAPRAVVGGPTEAATAAHAGERLHTLLGRLIVTDEDARVGMQIARRAFCDGVLGASLRIAAPTPADLDDLFSGLDPAQQEELETLLTAEVPTIDATTWPAVIRALKTLRPASPEVRTLAQRALKAPGGYARLRDADVAMTLYLYDIERPALAAGMVADLNGPDAKLARRMAHRVRIIGVASQESFARLVADASLETQGRDAIAADLGRMVPGPKRLALESALADARMVAEGIVRQ